MNQLHLLFVFAAGASICSAQNQSKLPTKAELARLNPPVTGVFAPSPLGGGSDDCLNAATQDAIAGLGNFAVDMTLATTSAGTNPGCGTMTKDVWFEWTSTVTGAVDVQLCGNTTSDVVLAVWSGTGCPVGFPIVCNDDSCNSLQSFVSFPAVASTAYMIQVGMYNNAAGVVTSMDIGTPPPPPVNDDCSTPTALPPGAQIHNYDSSAATTGSQGQTDALCNAFATTGIDKDLWYTWTATMGGPVSVSTCNLMTAPGAYADTKIAVWDGAGCPSTPAVGCNDDAGYTPANPVFTCTNIRNSTVDFTAVCGQTYTIQIGQYPGIVDDMAGAFQITQNGTTCSTPSVPFCTGDVVGSTCTNCVPNNNGAAGHGCANSSFATGALLTNSGNASVGNDTLVLTCSSMSGPGLFFQSNGLIAPSVFGDGMLCAAIGILRMGVVFPGPPNYPAGSANYPGGLTPNPITVAGGPIAANDTKHYQCWYRDAIVFCSSATFNTSNGISLTWIP